MDATTQEVALRAYTFAARRILEVTESDVKEGDVLPKGESLLVDFIAHWMAGSLFVDLFSESAIREMVEKVFTVQEIQTFVFDLRYHAMLGITETEIKKMVAEMAYHIAPGFVQPTQDNFGRFSNMGNVLREFQFADPKWQLTERDVTIVLAYMPWMVPLLLISIGNAIADGTNQDPVQP